MNLGLNWIGRMLSRAILRLRLWAGRSTSLAKPGRPKEKKREKLTSRYVGISPWGDDLGPKFHVGDVCIARSEMHEGRSKVVIERIDGVEIHYRYLSGHGDQMSRWLFDMWYRVV